jgi:hypothetical protein
LSRYIVDRDGTFPGLARATLDAIRQAVRTRARRWLVAITLLMGLVAAVATAAARPDERTFAGLSDPAQSLMSVMVPLFGILLVRDLHQAPRPAGVLTTLLAAPLAAAIGIFGAAACAVTLAVMPAGSAEDPWRDAGTVAVGSVLVQVVAFLVGTGVGLLLRSAVVAFLATIVVPLALWAALGGVEVLRPVQPWVTPYGTVRNLLSGQMTAVNWAQWFVVVLIWGVGLNAVGARLMSHRRRPGHR